MVRKARVDDAAAIARVHTETWRVAYRGIVDDDVLDGLEASRGRIEAWREILASESARVFVAEADGTVGGFASAGPSRDRDMEGEGEIYAIYVRPDLWGRALGCALIAAAEEALRELGFVEAGLWVLEDNPRARGFYEAVGWRLDDGARKTLPNESRARGLIEVRYRRRL